MNKSSKGFTLIELLVVIAIIGILAALVLVALGNARQKAQDARIKSNLGQLRTLAEVHYDSNTPGATYTKFDTCIGSGATAGVPADCAGGISPSVLALKTDITNAGGTAFVVKANAQSFCLSTTLASTTATGLCMDNAGTYKESSTAACPASVTGGIFACP